MSDDITNEQLTIDTAEPVPQPEPVAEAPAPEPVQPVTEEPAEMIIQDATPAGKKIFKPHGEEFSLDGDFSGIAAALGLELDAVDFSIIEDSSGNIDGKSLVGVAKA